MTVSQKSLRSFYTTNHKKRKEKGTMPIDATSANEALQMLGEGDISVFKTLRQMQEGSYQEAGLDPETFMLVRIAALAALDAAPASWLANLKAGTEINIDPQRVIGTLVAIAPVAGSARIVSAASSVARAIALHKVREHMR
jgi:4-carboxymuconolactone decarboxylase